SEKDARQLRVLISIDQRVELRQLARAELRQTCRAPFIGGEPLREGRGDFLRIGGGRRSGLCRRVASDKGIDDRNFVGGEAGEAAPGLLLVIQRVRKAAGGGSRHRRAKREQPQGEPAGERSVHARNLAHIGSELKRILTLCRL